MFRLRLVERVKVFALLHLFVKLFSLGDTCTHAGLSLRLFGGKSFRACTKKRGKYYSITLGNKDGGKRSSSARTSRLFGGPREGIAAKTLFLRR